MTISGVNTNTHSVGQDIIEYDPFKEFANFLDGVGLPAEWSPYLLPPERETELPEPALQYPRTAAGTPAARPGNPSRPGTPFSPWLPSAPGAARISANLTENVL